MYENTSQAQTIGSSIWFELVMKNFRGDQAVAHSVVEYGPGMLAKAIFNHIMFTHGVHLGVNLKLQLPCCLNYQNMFEPPV